MAINKLVLLWVFWGSQEKQLPPLRWFEVPSCQIDSYPVQGSHKIKSLTPCRHDMVRKHRSPNCVTRETGSVFGSPFCPNISANLDPGPFWQRGSLRQPLPAERTYWRVYVPCEAHSSSQKPVPGFENSLNRTLVPIPFHSIQFFALASWDAKIDKSCTVGIVWPGMSHDAQPLTCDFWWLQITAWVSNTPAGIGWRAGL